MAVVRVRFDGAAEQNRDELVEISGDQSSSERCGVVAQSEALWSEVVRYASFQQYFEYRLCLFQRVCRCVADFYGEAVGLEVPGAELVCVLRDREDFNLPITERPESFRVGVFDAHLLCGDGLGVF